MKQILVLYYSQSGDVAHSAKSFVKFLEESEEVNLVWECIQPKCQYPYPWNFYQFFDVFPECINGEPPEIKPVSFNPDEKFDLIILAYQVWFLSPSLPIQGFLKSEYARVLRDTKVITLVGCRNMWHSASERMKKMISKLGGIHLDNVVITHQGLPLATFITTPRLLLTGKKDKAFGILPPGGFRHEDIDSLSRFGKHLANHLDTLSQQSNQPLLNGLSAVEVNQNYVIPEWIGQQLYRPWAKIVRFFGKSGSGTRKPIVLLFGIQLIFAIPIVLLFSAIANIILAPLIHPKIQNYVEVLKSPSGVA